MQKDDMLLVFESQKIAQNASLNTRVLALVQIASDMKVDGGYFGCLWHLSRVWHPSLTRDGAVAWEEWQAAYGELWPLVAFGGAQYLQADADFDLYRVNSVEHATEAVRTITHAREQCRKQIADEQARHSQAVRDIYQACVQSIADTDCKHIGDDRWNPSGLEAMYRAAMACDPRDPNVLWKPS